MSGEEEDDAHIIDVEEKDFMYYYFSRFEQIKKDFESDLVRLQNSNKRKKNKKKNDEIKDMQNKINFFDEHQYYLDQLFNHRDMIDEDKLDNIKEDMENFLNDPFDQVNRDELTSEYQMIVEDIMQDLEEERIENEKEEQEKLNSEQKDEKLGKYFTHINNYLL